MPSAYAQSTVYVSNQTALRDAVTNAVGHTVIVLTADIQLTTTPLSIATGKDITLTSNTPSGFFRLIGASGQDTITVANGGQLELSGITVTHTSGATGRGVSVAVGGALKLTASTITGNTVSDLTNAYGGGIYNSGTLEINQHVTIANNTATTTQPSGTYPGTSVWGGGIYNDGNCTMLDGTVANNTLTTVSPGSYHNPAGGGIFNNGTFTLFNGTVANNTAVVVGTYNGDAGGIYNVGNFTMLDGTVTNNTANSRGGGVSNSINADIYLGSRRISPGNFTISGGTIANNTASEGGGIYNIANIVMSGGTIANNTAWSGGGINCDGVITDLFVCNFTMLGGTIANNTAQYNGGGIYTAGQFTMLDGVIINNTANRWGGGIQNDLNVTLFGGTIANNTATYGGGIANISPSDGGSYFYGNFTMLSGIIANNTAQDGGGIYLAGYSMEGSVELFRGIISDNTAVVNGGGVWVTYLGLNRLFVFDGMIFSSNRASVAYNRNPLDDELYANQIGPNVIWTLPFTQGYNNYDISYAYGTPLIIYTVTVNNSSAQITGAGSYLSDQTVTINAGTQPGYTFTNWTVNKGSIALPNTPTAVFTMPQSDVVVTANWALNTYNITYILNGGINDLSNPNTYTIEDLPLPIANPTKLHYNFTGWTATYTDGQSNITQPTPNYTIPQNTTANIILTAHWSESPNPGTLTITKQTNPPDTQTLFNFTLTDLNTTFSLMDGQTYSRDDLSPGIYTLTELPSSGWNLTDIIVVGTSNYTIDLTSRTLTFALESEQHLNLTFVNTQQLSPETGNFRVTKLTNPPDSEIDFSFVTSTGKSFSLSDDGNSWVSGEVPSGIYTVTELPTPNWELVGVNVVGTSNYTLDLNTGTLTFALETGQPIELSFINTERIGPEPGSFSVTKITTPTNTNTAFSFVTSASLGIFSLTNAETWNSGPIAPGNYTLTEITPLGWDLANIIVIDPTNNSYIDLSAGTAFINLSAGENISIIYQNTQQAPAQGSFSITKVSCPVDSSETFRFVTSAPAGSFNLTDGQSWSSGMLPPGTYTVTELVPPDWEITNIILNDPSGTSTLDLVTGTVTINLQAGTHISIIYQDAQVPPPGGLISVVKATCPVDTAAVFTFVSSASDGSFSLGNGEIWTSNELTPGRYTVTEIMQTGWAISDIIVADPSGTSTTDLSTGTVTINLQAGTHITIIYQNTEQIRPDCNCCKKDPCQCKPCNDCHQNPCQCELCDDCHQKPCQCKPVCSPTPPPPCDQKPNSNKPAFPCRPQFGCSSQLEGNSRNLCRADGVAKICEVGQVVEENLDRIQPEPDAPTPATDSAKIAETQTTDVLSFRSALSGVSVASSGSSIQGPLGTVSSSVASSDMPLSCPVLSGPSDLDLDAQFDLVQVSGEGFAVFGLGGLGVALVILLGAIITVLVVTASIYSREEQSISTQQIEPSNQDIKI